MTAEVTLVEQNTQSLTGYGADLVRMFYESLTPNTLEAYQYGLADFARFLEATVDGLPLRLLTAGNGPANALVLRWRTNLINRGLSPKTVNLRLSAVRSFVKLARTVGMISWPIDVPGLKAEVYKDTRGPGTAGVDKLLAEVDRREVRSRSKARRDRLLIRLLFDLGLRRFEAIGLDMAHVDLEAATGKGTVSVLGKGKRTRTALTLTAASREALVAWLEVRGTGDGPLFLRIGKSGLLGAPLSGPGAAAVMTDLGNSCNLRVRPHGLRHSVITALFDAGVDIRQVQKFSRHADIKTLMYYDDARTDLAGQAAEIASSLVGNKIPVETGPA